MKHTPKIFTAILLALNIMPVCAVAKDFKIPENEIPKNITGLGTCQSIAEEAFYCEVVMRTGEHPSGCSRTPYFFSNFTGLVRQELTKKRIHPMDLEAAWKTREELLPKVEQACNDYLEKLKQAKQSSQTASVKESAEKTEPVYQPEPVNKKETETLPVYQTQSETRATDPTPVSVDKTPTKTTAPTYINVSGKVIDTSGTPLPGITIQVAYKNGELANNSTITDENGLFSLNRVPSDTGLLVGGSTYEKKWVPTAANMNIRLEGYSADEVFVSCPSNAEWSDTEKHCVCKDTSKQYINGVCVDKPQRTSSLDAPQELPEETQTIPQYECEQLKTGTKWENGKCICINLEQELTDDGCVDKKTKKEKCNIPNALTTRRDGDVCKVVSCKPGYQKGNNNTACFKKDKTGKECGVRHGTGKFDANGKCILKKCNDDSYKLNEDKNTCEKINQRELNKQECDQDTGKEWKHGKCVNKCDDSATWDDGKGECVCKGPDEYMKNGKCVEIDYDTDDAENSTDTNRYDNSQTSENEPDPEKLAKLRQAYDDARETEQSHENRLLTTGATVATGIGGMELAKGLSEQNADKTAEQSMASYIATMRCKYGNGRQVKAGLEEIELPGGNDAQMMQLRAEYIALANDLKTRKETLGMKPGIESEKILDKSQIGLYDDENIGITDGAYSSLYRAQIYETQKDQEQIDKDTKTSKNRVIGGAVAGGVGAVGGTLGDSLINGKLNEVIESKKNK